MDLTLIFSRRVSTFFSFLIIVFFAFVLGTIIILQSKKLMQLERPVPFYIQDFVVSEQLKD